MSAEPDGNKLSDAEIKARLTEIAGFTPADGWAHVVHQLRLGKIFLVRHFPGISGGGVRPLCQILDPVKEPMILPCPFCGMTAKGIVDDLGDKVCVHLKELAKEEYVVTCDNCGTVGPMELDKANAIRLWNLRSLKGSQDGN